MKKSLDFVGNRKEMGSRHELGYLGLGIPGSYSQKSASPCLSHAGEDEQDGQDGSDENPSWNLGPSRISEASFPAEFQDEGESPMFLGILERRREKMSLESFGFPAIP